MFLVTKIEVILSAPSGGKIGGIEFSEYADGESFDTLEKARAAARKCLEEHPAEIENTDDRLCVTYFMAEIHDEEDWQEIIETLSNGEEEIKEFKEAARARRAKPE